MSQPAPRDVVAALDAKAERVRGALYGVAGGALVYVIALIAVLSQLRTPLPDWIRLLLLPIPLFVIAIPALRVWRRSLMAQAALAQVASARDSVDELAAEP